MVLLTFGSAEELQNNLNIVQFTYGLISPAGCLLRVLLLALNQSQLLCRAQSLVSYPADIEVYGSSYLNFILQSFALYAFLVAYDSGWRISTHRLAIFSRSNSDIEKHGHGHMDDVLVEQQRTENSSDELKLLHLYKEFQHKPAVNDVTFGVRRGEILAL